MHAQKRVRVTVNGSVQGVFFRASTAEMAKGLEIVGYVRNLANQSVEFEAQGSPEAVDALCEWAKIGPPAAKVDDMRIEELEIDESNEGFEIRR